MKRAILAHGLRAVLLGIAAWCSAAALTGRPGVIAAVVGAMLGVLAGELVARRPWRLWVIAAAGLIGAAVLLVLAAESTRRELIPSLIGPAHALALAAILRYGAVAAVAVTLVRAGARRVPALGVIEVAATVAAVALPFAAHRDGQIARPLWLGDWAWRHAIDPATVLVAIGVAVAAALALLLLLDSRQRPAFGAFIALPAIGIIAALLFAAKSRPPAAPPSEAGDAKLAKGDEPLAQNTRKGNDPGQGGGMRTGSGGQPRQGSGGQNGQGQRPPPPSDWQDPSQGNGKSTPMAIVLLGDDYQPAMQGYYFRQETWSELYGSRLISPRDRTFDPDVPRGEPSGTLTQTPPADAPGMKLLHADVALLVQQRKPFFLGEPTRWEQTVNPDPDHFVRTYQFESVVQTLPLQQLLGHEAGSPDWPPELRDYYLELPPDPRYADLAQQIIAKLPDRVKDDPFARAAAIRQWLEQNTAYSLSHRHANVPDPVADFLFGDRIGYCVHIAHAAVYLWRAAGIPARIGVGYMVEADHRRGSSLLVRAGDAHAWPELYLDGVGWVVFDVSPAKNLDPPSQPPDDDMQQRLAELARGKPPAGARDADYEPRPERRPLGKPLALAGGSVIALVLLALYTIKLWRRLVPVFAPQGELPRVAYRAALDLLADAGRTRTRGETREHFARRLAVEVPVFAEITTLHLAARLGPPGRPAASRAEWRALLARLRAELAARAPLARRVARKLHPISFRSSR